jgi:Flp pilus assembly CpaF family ATPase
VAALVEAAMRLRPDRLVVGEIRYAREAYQTLEALNTGHPGSVTTIHANGPLDAVRRLEMLVGREFRQLAPGQIRAYVAGVIDLVVHLDHRSGRRAVSAVVALDDVNASGDLAWCGIYPQTPGSSTWPARLRQRLDSAGDHA